MYFLFYQSGYKCVFKLLLNFWSHIGYRIKSLFDIAIAYIKLLGGGGGVLLEYVVIL